MSPSGEAYVIHSIWDRTSTPMWLSVVGRDGKIKKAKLLSLTSASCGPQKAGCLPVVTLLDSEDGCSVRHDSSVGCEFPSWMAGRN